jgi:fido (protein-threonine AMPylation protein)
LHTVHILPDEIATRFHHRLVWIHPFPNGNGRVSRTMTDLLLESQGTEPFSWGGENIDLVGAGEIRDRYINALRAADAGDYRPLIEFVRSGS